ncbi:glycosyltransferase [Acetobacter sp. TBRC 12305]|uniref:Glycosyltransferase family 2 protein n=1 Tax=Acetobacter garciniae TaxID=2817435 RepID=A0A939KL74_9PROT|nr:glycosyltransferase family 2 protein [Acetobacter garciniae]MBO1323978.1 glycosyltransferase family 2 protein [Acetobacter garciniae]MBX0343667.1 glycosyltransferase [Acetobacter garciniae]
MESGKSSIAKVAIIVRTKNRPLFLKRAIESIISQTFPDWHVYIINDGGEPANLKEIIGYYGKSFLDKVSLIDVPVSSGRGGALSFGIGLAREDYIAIHDDDDTWEPAFLEKTVSYLDHDTAEVFSGVTTSNHDIYEYVDNNRIVIKEKSSAAGKKSGTIVDFAVYLSGVGVILPITFLFRRGLIETTGNVNTTMNHYEDYDLFVRLMMCGEIGIIEDFLCSYHHREPTGMASDTSRHEKNFDYHLAYRNNVIREAINNKSGLKVMQASFIHGKTINDFHTNHLVAQINGLAQGVIAMSNALARIVAKLDKDRL